MSKIYLIFSLEIHIIDFVRQTPSLWGLYLSTQSYCCAIASFEVVAVTSEIVFLHLGIIQNLTMAPHWECGEGGVNKSPIVLSFGTCKF